MKFTVDVRCSRYKIGTPDDISRRHQLEETNLALEIHSGVRAFELHEVQVAKDTISHFLRFVASASLGLALEE